MFSGSALSLSKNRFCATEEADIYRRYKQIHYFKKIGISQHNVLRYECLSLTRQKLSANFI